MMPVKIYSVNKLKENTFLPGPILIVSSWPHFLIGISGLALWTLFRQYSSLKGFRAYLPSHWLLRISEADSEF